MKRIDLLAAALLALAAAEAKAQTEQTDSAVTTTTTTTTLENRLDSLQRTVTVLQEKEDERSKREYDAAVWKRKKYFMLGYTTQTIKADYNEDTKSKFGVSLNWGRTYYLHKKPIANLLKIGLDWTWLSLYYVNYKMDDADYDYYDEGDSKPSMHSIDVGMGIGPSVTVSPFYSMGKGLQHILLRTYFHVIPSYTCLLSSEDGSTDVYHAYTTYFKWGINVSYKVISVGYEYRWGSSKFSGTEFDYDDDEGYGFNPSDTKPTFKFGANTLYVRFCF